MVVRAGSASCASVVVAPSSEILFELKKVPVQAIAPVNVTSIVHSMNSLEIVLKTVDCIVSLLCMKELVNAALELLVMVGADEYPSSYPEISKHLFIKAPDFRFATYFDTPSAQESNLRNEALLNDEMDRSCDQCKACMNEMLLQGPVQEADCLWGGGISEWIVSAARGKEEVNSNHAETGKAFVGGKKDKTQEDDDDDEDDVNGESDSGDEENDDGDEVEEDGNEVEDDDDEEDEEDEEEDDEDDEGVAPLSAHINKAVQNDEEDDDSDEGEEEEEGVEDEDDFEEDGEDDDGEDAEEDEDDDEDEDVPEPPKKKNKSS